MLGEFGGETPPGEIWPPEPLATFLAKLVAEGGGAPGTFWHPGMRFWKSAWTQIVFKPLEICWRVWGRNSTGRNLATGTPRPRFWPSCLPRGGGHVLVPRDEILEKFLHSNYFLTLRNMLGEFGGETPPAKFGPWHPGHVFGQKYVGEFGGETPPGEIWPSEPLATFLAKLVAEGGRRARVGTSRCGFEKVLALKLLPFHKNDGEGILLQPCTLVAGPGKPQPSSHRPQAIQSLSTFSCEPTTNVFHGFNLVFTFSCPAFNQKSFNPALAMVSLLFALVFMAWADQCLRDHPIRTFVRRVPRIDVAFDNFHVHAQFPLSLWRVDGCLSLVPAANARLAMPDEFVWVEALFPSMPLLGLLADSKAGHAVHGSRSSKRLSRYACACCSLGCGACCERGLNASHCPLKSRLPWMTLASVHVKKLVVGPWVGSIDPPLVCTGRFVPSTGDALLSLTGRVVPPVLHTTAKAFAKDVFINQERKLGARRRSDTVLVSTINDANQGSADVALRTPLAPYEKSKSLGSGGSIVARLKLKGIDGRAPPGAEPAA
ncbi:hypothetical protein Fmac_032993 [Flemingia macrophylla]|uniref:Uncharacterized protein n=1 Tax=Flemingia macrophylla TaxID=520843 RepID=A0ABD1L6G9_9FABA